jgi:hypothetical protein
MIRIVLVLALLSSVAHAEAPFAPHLTTGVELMGGGAFSLTNRTQLGVSLIPDVGARRQLTLTLGGTFAAGTISADDPRALDGSVDVGYRDWGPQVQLGVRFNRSGFIRNRAFASVAYLRTDLDDRLTIDPVGGVGGTQGFRATVGLNWARTWGDALVAKPRGDTSDERDGNTLMKVMLFIVPQQLEVGWIRSAGSDRVGITVSFGI